LNALRMSDLILFAGDAMEADKFQLLAHYLLPFVCIIRNVP
jgi:hypothetical protein